VKLLSKRALACGERFLLFNTAHAVVLIITNSGQWSVIGGQLSRKRLSFVEELIQLPSTAVH
jgi:hypothetical protein